MNAKTNSKVPEFLAEIEKLSCKATANSRTGTFTRIARQIVTSAYNPVNGQQYFIIREAGTEYADTTKADKLVEMGAVEAVYGRGRTLLHK